MSGGDVSDAAAVAAPPVAPVTREIDQPRVDAYAAAAPDQNPFHRETPEAAASQFGRPIAHGMLVLALVSEAMTAAHGLRWWEFDLTYMVIRTLAWLKLITRVRLPQGNPARLPTPEPVSTRPVTLPIPELALTT